MENRMGNRMGNRNVSLNINEVGHREQNLDFRLMSRERGDGKDQ